MSLCLRSCSYEAHYIIHIIFLKQNLSDSFSNKPRNHLLVAPSQDPMMRLASVTRDCPDLVISWYHSHSYSSSLQASSLSSSQWFRCFPYWPWSIDWFHHNHRYWTWKVPKKWIKHEDLCVCFVSTLESRAKRLVLIGLGLGLTVKCWDLDPALA